MEPRDAAIHLNFPWWASLISAIPAGALYGIGPAVARTSLNGVSKARPVMQPEAVTRPWRLQRKQALDRT
jgi:hypothetical protein